MILGCMGLGVGCQVLAKHDCGIIRLALIHAVLPMSY